MAIKPGIHTEEKDLGAKELRKAYKKMDGLFTTIGVHDGAGSYTGGKNPPSVAEVAGWNEFGTTDESGKQLIPPRPAIRMGLEGNLASLNRLSNSLIGDISRGTKTPVKVTEAMGFRIKTEIQNMINTSQSWAKANAPSTIAKKIKGGAARGPTPLIESTLYLRSITFEVNK